MIMDDIILKRFENPDEVRTFEKGKFEVINLGGMAIGKATYQPGWKWSVDVSPYPVRIFARLSILGWLSLVKLRVHSRMGRFTS